MAGHPPNVPPQVPNPADPSASNNKMLKQSQETSSTNGFQDYHQVLSGSVGGGTQDNRNNMVALANQSAPVDNKMAMKVAELGPSATSTGIKKQLLE